MTDLSLSLLIPLKVGATSLDPTGPVTLKHLCDPFRDMFGALRCLGNTFTKTVYPLNLSESDGTKIIETY